MTNANDPAYPTMEHGYDIVGTPCVNTVPGLTTLAYIATHISISVPDFFYHVKLKEFDDIKGSTRRTEGHAAKMMSTNEVVETMAAWRVKLAKALIKELNKEQ